MINIILATILILVIIIKIKKLEKRINKLEK